MIGGHIDHLGFGNRGGTLAKGEAATQIHFGADDNGDGRDSVGASGDGNSSVIVLHNGYGLGHAKHNHV